MTVATVASTTSGISPSAAPAGRTGCAAARIVQQQRALAEVVEHQRRQHQANQAQADRLAAEVAHVGVQRFGAGQGQHDRAEQRTPCRDAAVTKKRTRTQRIERRSTAGACDDLMHARAPPAPGTTPPSPGRTACRPAGAVALDQEQRHQHDAARSGTTQCLSAGVGDLQAPTADSTEIAGVITPSP